MKKRYFSILLVFALVLSSLGICGTCVSTYSLEKNVIRERGGTQTEKLKIVGVIPARYASSRFPGKPLADICGKPMIWWVYQQAKKVPELDEIYVATDDERIENVCKQYDMNVIMTSKNHPNHISRVQEVSNKIQADYYICVNGDEPLIEPKSVSTVVPKSVSNDIYVGGAMRKLIDPAETIDSANIKVIVNKNKKCMFMSRMPIPFPKGSLNFSYNKYVGIECFNKQALDFFVNTEMSELEKIEDIDHLRFIDNSILLSFSEVESDSISVDTPKDLDKVREIMKKRLEKENHIKILDCTLRDGGYINDWNFGEENINEIINKLSDSNVDIIECGFYEPCKNDNKDKSNFKDLQGLDGLLHGNQKFCVMLVYGCCNIDDVPNNTFNHVQTIRVSFHKDSVNDALIFCKKLQEKGYNISIQPVNALNYTLDEFKALVEQANEINPYAFYIVDTLGTMSEERMLTLFDIADKNLSKDISIGFHSHNNLQLSHSNAQALMNLDTNRNIIIDSSVFGMGRGAGNLCTELLMQDLNERYGEKYDLSSIYKIFDEHLSSTFEKTPWGYSMPLFISAKYKCHPNYAIFLKDRGSKSNTNIDKIISRIENNKKSVFDKAYIEKLYNDFFNCKQYDCITFDLDGTIIDSSEGIFNAIRHTEKELGIEPLPEDKLKLCVGPTLKYTYGVLHELNEELTNKAINIHKEYMSQQGYKQCKLYDGIDDLLKTLKNKNIKLAVATLKQEFIANQTLKYLGIDKYFDMILGQNGSESLEKSDLLKEISKKFNTKNIVLIGDTKFDGEAALKAGVDFIAVTYGMGFRTTQDAEAFSPVKVYSSISNVKKLGGIYVLK